jgi:hypothetical protein
VWSLPLYINFLFYSWLFPGLALRCFVLTFGGYIEELHHVNVNVLFRESHCRGPTFHWEVKQRSANQDFQAVISHFFGIVTPGLLLMRYWRLHFTYSVSGCNWDWVYLVCQPLIGLLYQPWMIDDDCGAVSGMRIGRGDWNTWEKPAPVPLCPPQVPHDLTWAQTWDAAVGSRWLTAWAMAQPTAS